MIKIERKTGPSPFELYVKPECILEIEFNGDHYASIKLSTRTQYCVVSADDARVILAQLNTTPEDEKTMSKPLNDSGSVSDLLDFE